MNIPGIPRFSLKIRGAFTSNLSMSVSGGFCVLWAILKGGDRMIRAVKNKMISISTTIFLAISFLFTSLPTNYAFAAGADPFSKINSGAGTIGGDRLFNDANRAVYTIYVFGGIWVLGCLIVGCMLLAGSGSNPQRRTGGLVAIAMALVSGIVLVNAYDMVGWMK